MDGDRSMSVLGRPLVVLSVHLQRGAAAVVLGLLVAAALMVVARRLAGALETPLEPPALLITGTLLAIAAIAIRLAWLPTSTSPWLRFERATMIVTSLAVAALGGGLCVRGTPILGMLLLVTLLGAEESWAWARYLRQGSPLVVAHPSPLTPCPLPLVPHGSDITVFPEDVTQQLTRSQAADGTEELSGWLRTAFTPGQRTCSVHVAFCPPFAATPGLEVEQIDGPEARVKTAQLLPYGVRLDLKLAAVAEEPTNVVLQFAARTT